MNESSSMNYFFRHIIFSAIAFLSCILVAPQAQALPPKIEADRQLQAAAHEMKQDTIAWKRVVEALYAAESTGVNMPESFDFHLGMALNEIQDYDKALQRLTRYLETHGKSGKFYKSALDQFNIAEKNNIAKNAEKAAKEELEKSWQRIYFRYWVMDTAGEGTCSGMMSRISYKVKNDKAIRRLDCDCSREEVDHPAFRNHTQDVCKGSLEFNSKLSAAPVLDNRSETNQWSLRFKNTPFE